MTCHEIKTQADYDAHKDEPRACLHVSAGYFAASGSASVVAYGSASVVASGSASVVASGSASVAAYGSASVAAYDSASVAAYDSASVAAYDSASVKAYDSASVKAYDSASVKAYDSASVKAYGSASVKASGSASVKASGSASVKAYGSASVVASGSASVAAYGSASVKASGSASVKASGSASVKAYDSASVKATPCVAIQRQPHHSGPVTGGVVIQIPDTSECDIDVWCSYYGIEITDGTMIVYKAVDQDLKSGHCDTPYPIGETVTAEDYQATRRCGHGLHFGPTTRRAASNAVRPVDRYLACRVKASEAIALGDKIKARSCEVLYEVDATGDRIAAAVAVEPR